MDSRDDFVPGRPSREQVCRRRCSRQSRWHWATAGLGVEQNDLRAGEDFLGVSKSVGLAGDVGTVHPQPEAVFAAGILGDCVVEVPLFSAAGVGPFYPLAEGGVGPIAGLGERGVGEGLEAAGAIGAVADLIAVSAGPTVVGKTFRVIALDDFAHDVGEELVIVRGIDAGEVEVAAHVGLTVGVGGDPVGVGVEEGPMDFGGIHAGDDSQAVVVGGLGEFAEEVAILEVRRLVMEGEFWEG